MDKNLLLQEGSFVPAVPKMRTVTFDAAVYKLVPVAESSKWRENLTKIGYSHRSVIADVLSAVPADLPGVVEHSGEPVAVCENECNVLWLDDNLPDGTQLFTHAPAQPNAEALTLLSCVFDAWENGTECHEDGGTYLGMAFRLDDGIFKKCCDLLNLKNPPRNTAQPDTAMFNAMLMEASRIDGAMPDTAALQARIAELEAHAIAKPEFAAVLAAMGDDLDYEIGLAESIDRLKTRVLQAEAQLAAQAGQEPILYTAVPIRKIPSDWPKLDPTNAAFAAIGWNECRDAVLKAQKSAPSVHALNETAMMAECMDMVRQDLIEAGIIDKAVPPMMVSDAVSAYFGRLRIAIVQAALEAAAHHIEGMGKLRSECAGFVSQPVSAVTFNYAKAIRALDPQTILDGMTK